MQEWRHLFLIKHWSFLAVSLEPKTYQPSLVFFVTKSTWLRSSKGFESVGLQRKVQVKLVNDSGNISPLNGSSLVRIELTLKMLRHTFCRASKRSNHCSILLCWKRDRVEQRQQLTLVQIILQTPLKIGTRRHVNGINDNDSVVGRASEQLKGCTLLLDDTTHSMWLHTVEFTHVLRGQRG